jgi:hypothetical protein
LCPALTHAEGDVEITPRGTDERQILIIQGVGIVSRSYGRMTRSRTVLASLVAPLVAVLIVEIPLLIAGVVNPDWFGVAAFALVLGGPLACGVSWLIGVPVLLALRAFRDSSPLRSVSIGLALGLATWAGARLLSGLGTADMQPAIGLAALTAGLAGAGAGWAWWRLSHKRQLV